MSFLSLIVFGKFDQNNDKSNAKDLEKIWKNPFYLTQLTSFDEVE